MNDNNGKRGKALEKRPSPKYQSSLKLSHTELRFRILLLDGKESSTPWYLLMINDWPWEPLKETGRKTFRASARSLLMLETRTVITFVLKSLLRPRQWYSCRWLFWDGRGQLINHPATQKLKLLNVCQVDVTMPREIQINSLKAFIKISLSSETKLPF
jgi:hypothetical protein